MDTLSTNLAYLFSAYTAIWVILFAYLMRLLRHERELRQQLEALVSEIQNKGATADV